VKREQIKASDYMWPDIHRHYAEQYAKNFNKPSALFDLCQSKRPPLPWWKRRLNVLRCRWTDLRIWLSRLIYPWDDCC
jgi:hypothetical protein